MSGTEPNQNDSRGNGLPPGVSVGDVVEAYVPCLRCRQGDACPHGEREYACIQAADGDWIVFAVARPAIAGQYVITSRSVPARHRNIELTRLEGTGTAGLLAHLFTVPGTTDGVVAEALREYPGLPYDEDLVHAYDMHVLLVEYLAYVDSCQAFLLLEHSLRVCGDVGPADVPADDWARAFDWRNADPGETGASAVVAARTTIMGRLLIDGTPAEILGLANESLRRLDLGNDSRRTAAILLIGMVWRALFERMETVLDTDGRDEAAHLLSFALDIDAALDRPPLFWASVDPLPGVDAVGYRAQVRDALIRWGESYADWRQAYAYARQTKHAPAALEYLEVPASQVDQSWLRLWEDVWDLGIFDSGSEDWRDADACETARARVLDRLVGYDVLRLVPLLDRTGAFWQGLSGAQKEEVITTVYHRAFDKPFARGLLINGRLLPEPIAALLELAAR